MSHKRKIQIASKPKRSVSTENLNLKDIIYINFTKYPKWTNTVKVKNFNNCLKDVNEASRHFFFIVDQLIPDIESYGSDIFTQKAKHCLILQGKHAKIAKEIIRKIHGDKVLDEGSKLFLLVFV